MPHTTDSEREEYIEPIVNAAFSVLYKVMDVALMEDDWGGNEVARIARDEVRRFERVFYVCTVFVFFRSFSDLQAPESTHKLWDFIRAQHTETQNLLTKVISSKLLQSLLF